MGQIRFKDSSQIIMKAEGFSVSYKDGFCLRPLDMYIRKGEIVAVVGESGSGKSTLVRGLAMLLKDCAKINGSVYFKTSDISLFNEGQLNEIRMKDIAVVFQNSSEVLNPSMTLREHMYEVLKKKYKRSEYEEIAVELMKQVDLNEMDLNRYPKELSGGMTQRFMIAVAISLKPDMLILDEPTSSLDWESTEKTAKLLREINEKYGMSILLITHDLAMARSLSHRVMILYKGLVVEEGETNIIFDFPKHPYTRGLFNSSMDLNIVKDIWGIEIPDTEIEASCPFYDRCTQSIEECRYKEIKHQYIEDRKIACIRGGIVKLIRCDNIKKKYGNKDILAGIDMELYSGEIISIVGKSGSGKTTLVSIASGFLNCDEGNIYFKEKKAEYKILHKARNGLQMIFQDSDGAINLQMTVYQVVSEPLVLSVGKNEYTEKVKGVLRKVGFVADEKLLNTRVKDLSGGQKQRIALARALIMEPEVLIADEPTSMLDASTKANVLRMLKGIQNKSGFAMIMVTHDMASALKISDRVYKLEEGRLKLYNGGK